MAEIGWWDPAAVWPTPTGATVRAFGLNWRGALPIGGAWSTATKGDPGIEIRRAPYAVAAELQPVLAETIWGGTTDGLPFRAFRGRNAEVVMVHGDDALFVLDAERMTLTVAATETAHPVTVARVLADSVMFTVALELGLVALHGAALSLDGAALLILGATGVGKSTLARALIQRGAQLLCDDVIVVSTQDDRVLAHPAAPVATIPSNALTADARPSAIADVGDETWLSAVIGRVPCAVERVVILGDGDALTSPGLADLRPHVMAVPEQFARQRFNALADLLQFSDVTRLRARSGTPDEMAMRLLPGGSSR